MDVQRDNLILPNPSLPIKRVLPGAALGLTGELLLWAKEQGLADSEPLFFSRKRVTTGVITDAHSVLAGETWTTVIRGLPLPGLGINFE